MSWIAAAVVAYVGVSAYQADSARKGANKQADAAMKAARIEQESQIAIANQQQAQAVKAQQDAQAFETQRAATLAASQKQLAADEALSAQNQTVSELTPTVQLAANTEAGGASAARKRRAAFRPEYASGVTI